MRKGTKIASITVIFAIAFCLIMYPVVSNLYNAYREKQLIADYQETVAEIEEEDLTEEWEKAEEYNRLFALGEATTELYEDALNVQGNGMMGYITIPTINVSLPVYHYATDDILAIGVGHLQTSALPIGGESTHSVLTGHRGLPGSTLFTDLDQVSIGDEFYITVLGETLAYEVTDIQVVLPEETDSLAVVEGEDLCTLVTCTPYGINTHRLLVTGTRTDYTPEDAETVAETISQVGISMINWILILVAILEIVIYILVIRIINRDYAKAQNKPKPQST